MKDNRTLTAPLYEPETAAHFNAGSALLEFIAGRLGAPGCWPNESLRQHLAARASDEMNSLHRWETDGGQTFALLKYRSVAPQYFHTVRPLLTQLI